MVGFVVVSSDVDNIVFSEVTADGVAEAMKCVGFVAYVAVVLKIDIVSLVGVLVVVVVVFGVVILISPLVVKFNGMCRVVEIFTAVMSVTSPVVVFVGVVVVVVIKGGSDTVV